MTKRFELLISDDDVGLVDQMSDATFSLRSSIGLNGVRISVLETTDEGLAAQWAHILDRRERAYVARVLEGADVVSERCVRNPKWRQA
ncbi:hypothetical protein AWB82_06380 [Caballeronia glebae]|uniref:Uncharacterized protein n=1 Tax=Caballeronia glebae TaxID=1777143 RepID=A0A158D8Q9_9BURK|nr:hypothetical protein [Caballeronia glebae]SAK90606.1 hypothetical protein AWB82_06380 [Caballeronia glebae]